MQDVVTGVQLEMVRETFLASLYVNADTLQIFRRGSAYQPEVRLVEGLKTLRPTREDRRRRSRVGTPTHPGRSP